MRRRTGTAVFERWLGANTAGPGCLHYVMQEALSDMACHRVMGVWPSYCVRGIGLHSVIGLWLHGCDRAVVAWLC